MTKETKNPIVKFILNKGEIGNIHTALKTLITEGLTNEAKDDVALMKIMDKLAPIYDSAAHGDVLEVELDPQSAYTCWAALSFILERALAPKSQQTKLITLVQHLGYALETLNNLKEDK